MMKDGYYEIDVLRMFRAIWHRIWIVILACVLCAGGHLHMPGSRLPRCTVRTP